MPLSSSLLSLISVLLLVAHESTGSSVCNENTPFECKCSRCYWHFSSQNDSIVVEFEQCPDANELDLVRLRTRVAFWLKEDCGFILRCPHFFAKDLDERNIVITEFLCAPEGIPSRVGLLGLWNASGNSETMDSRVELDVLQSVLANRDHLLSHELRSPLLRIGRGSELVRKRSVEFTWQQLVKYGAVSAAITFACSSTLVLCVALKIVGWGRVSAGLLCCRPEERREKTLQELNAEYRRRGDQAMIPLKPLPAR